MKKAECVFYGNASEKNLFTSRDIDSLTRCFLERTNNTLN